MRPVITLGETIRGARLGWGWCDEIGAFVRMSDVGQDTLIDVRPPGTLPRSGMGDEHRIWWAADGGYDHTGVRFVGRELRRLIAGGLDRVRVRRPLQFVLRAVAC